MKVLTQIFSVLALIISFNVLSFTPTASQIEQLKNLPRAQQEAFAKQYGVDLSTITGPSQSNNQSQIEQPTIGERPEAQQEQSNNDERFNPKKDELKPFGYSLFSGEPTTFMPSEKAAIPDSYLIGPGDQLNISLYGKKSDSFKVTVDRDGKIIIPDLTPVQVAGLTFFEVKALIDAKVEQEVIGVKAFVSLGQLRSMRILVLGEAYKPGSYSVSPLTTVSHALFVSGGVSDIASLRNIQVKRAGKLISNFDLYDLLIKGDSSKDIVLKPGDVVFVPSVGAQVRVDGLVKRPAIFELKQGESAKQLLNMAGGFKPNAYIKNAIVERFNADRKEILSVDFSANEINYIPQDGDMVRFDGVSEQYQNSISLIGAVVRPGHYQWREGKNISDIITSIKGDLLPQADLNYGLVIREVNSKGDIEVHQFNPAEAIAKKGHHDLLLKNNDKLYIFSRYQDRETEKNALANMALTAEQQLHLQKIQQWNMYQEKEFKDLVGVNIDSAKMADSTLALVDSTKRVNIESYSLFSRYRLLRAIIEKLKLQADNQSEMKLVEVSGHVNYPGVYPLAEGNKVNDLITAAGGLLESAYTDRAEITRAFTDGSSKIEHIQFNLQGAIRGDEESDITLSSKDNLNIFPIPNWQESAKVTLRGELKFPGTYTIRRGETLSDLLNRAGGVTEFAEPKAAIFTRQSIKEQQQKQLTKLSDDLRKEIATRSFQSKNNNSVMPYDEIKNILADLAQAEALGRLVIDLPSIVEKDQTLILKDNDQLFVPSKQDSVSIIGEVNYSTSYLYNPKLTVDDYIDRSGGVKDRADKGGIYIIKANGSVVIPDYGNWFVATNDNKMLEPGDTIVVPLDSDYMDNLTLWSTATQILYQLGVAVAALSAL